jgi:hypothetical protein
MESTLANYLIAWNWQASTLHPLSKHGFLPMSIDAQLSNHARQTEKVRGAWAKALQARTLKSLEQLRSMAAMNLPSERRRQMENLIETAQTYSVFIEDLMGLEQGGSIEKVGKMLDQINTHCNLIDRAYHQSQNI